MNDELKGLVRDSKHINHGYVCQRAERVLLPLWLFKAAIWATTQGGARQLDEIFLGLLKNGATSRKEIAEFLGVDEDEFVFSHLDALERAGYVAFVDGTYRLTTEGQRFESGSMKEERLEKEKFPFVWDDMSGTIESEDIISRKSTSGVKRLKHHWHRPKEDVLLRELVPHFNAVAKFRGSDSVFYDLDSTERQFSYRKTYAEYVALFYEPESGAADLLVDLRAYDNDKQIFRLCGDLSRVANDEKYWREQFKEIYEINRGD